MVRFFRASGLPSRRSRGVAGRRRTRVRASDLKLESLEPRLALAGIPGLPDTVAPVVRSVTLPAAGTYGTDRALSFKVNFSEPVKITGDQSTVTLPVQVGDAMREARYVSGSGTTSLTFRMTVAANDVDTDGISVGRLSSAAIRDFGFNEPGTTPRIVDRAGNPASNAIPALDTSGIRVDAIGPVVESFGTFVIRGQQVSLRVTFDEPVFVKGKPTVPVIIGGRERSLVYAAGSGTTTLTFAVTVPKGASVASPAFRGENGLPGEVILLPAGAHLKDRFGNAIPPGDIAFGKKHIEQMAVPSASHGDTSPAANREPLAWFDEIRLGTTAPVSAPPAPPMLLRSSPPQSPPFVLPPAVNGVVEVSTAITADTTFRAGTIYVITGEVHVACRVTLTIEDGVEVRIRNGKGTFMFLTSPALIFDSGSSLVAKKVTFQAANDANEPVTEADNGGVFFCGGTRAASRDNISSRNTQLYPSSFSAECIVANFLGRKDPRGGDGDGSKRDDIDALSVIGVVYKEWDVKAVESHHSGNNGLSLTDSSIQMASVQVHDPVEDGIDLTSSVLGIDTLLRVIMTENQAVDREIFDFEVDNGIRSVIGLPRDTATHTTTVDLQGYWDNRRIDDWIDVSSDDMKRPEDGIRQWYSWTGTLVRSPAQIYSRKRTV